MKWFLFLVCIVPWVSGSAAAKAPNVVVILTDDQGSMDAGCYGSKDLITPNTDALAARGVRFTQFYSAAPVCSPSRAGLLTGCYPVRAGVPGNCSSQRGGHAGLPPEMVTLAERFHAAGYRTAHVGKWHLGYTEGMLPNDQGFDHSFGHMGGCIDNYSHFFYWSGPNVHDLYRNGDEVHLPGRFFPDLMAEEAEKFIRTEDERPFFIYFAMNAPHYPYQGEPEYLEKLNALPYPRNLYAAFLASQDRCLGRVLTLLDELQLREETIVVFQSDNGHSEEERAHFGGGNPGPYRGEKFSLFEGGIRLPAMISWPGHLPEGVVRDQLGHACDWAPTLADLCGIEIPAQEIDGKSLVGVVMDDAPSPHTDAPVHWQVGEGANAQWAVRLGPWKLIGHPRGGDLPAKGPKLWLSRLDEDVGEQVDLSAEHPEKVLELEALHQQWLKSLGR
ncbi:MAG: sulfatase-like hydrolase/transferase [Verrucomicrobiales bacterium]|nr:sulfatase-like hydrolase/transferase [Verrucomicrobiales bacterium]